MSQLDEDSVTHILRFTSPRDLCSLARVSKTWAAAARSDTAWQPFLPDDYSEVFRRREDPEAPPRRAVDCFRRLAEGVLLEDRKQHVRLDRATGRVRYSVSKDSFGITWGDDMRYWCHLPGNRFSVFDSIAHLLNVCWFEINGDIPLKLPRGIYSVYWRVSRNPVDLMSFYYPIYRSPPYEVDSYSDEPELEGEAVDHDSDAEGDYWDDGVNPELEIYDETNFVQPDPDMELHSDSLSGQSGEASAEFDYVRPLPHPGEDTRQMPPLVQGRDHEEEEEEERDATATTVPEILDAYTSGSSFYWSTTNASSSIRTANGTPIALEFPINTDTLAGFPQWTHLRAGEIVIDDSTMVDGVTHLHARLYEIEGGDWKSGIYFDGIVLEKA